MPTTGGGARRLLLVGHALVVLAVIGCAPKSLTTEVEATRRAQQALLVEVQEMRAVQEQQGERRVDAEAEMILALEDLETRIDRLENQLRDLLEGLDRRGAAPPPSGDTSLAGAAPTEPRRQYEAAYLEVTRGNYDLAIAAFEEFLRHHPATDLSDNAVYWIGECHYARQEYDRATEAFVRLMDTYPDGDKVPAGMLKLGFSFSAQGDQEAGCRYLRTLVERFPSSEEADLAKPRLADC